MAAWITIQHLHDRVFIRIETTVRQFMPRINYRNGGGQGIGRDHIGSVRTDRRLNRQGADKRTITTRHPRRSVQWAARATSGWIVLLDQINPLDLRVGGHIHDRYGVIKEIGHVILARIRHHARGNWDSSRINRFVDHTGWEIIHGRCVRHFHWASPFCFRQRSSNDHEDAWR